jgi:hypothetical protein
VKPDGRRKLLVHLKLNPAFQPGWLIPWLHDPYQDKKTGGPAEKPVRLEHREIFTDSA